MSATVTVTGKIGPAVTATATVLNNITSFTCDCVNNILTAVGPNNIITRYDINAATTVTCTKSAAVWALTIS